MDIQLAATILLIERLIAVTITIFALRIAYRNLRALNDPEVRIVRVVLHGFAIALLVHNLIPIAIDAITIFGDIERSTQKLNPIGGLYAFNNATSAIIFAVGFLLIFVAAGVVNRRMQERNKVLQTENDELHSHEQ